MSKQSYQTLGSWRATGCDVFHCQPLTLQGARSQMCELKCSQLTILMLTSQSLLVVLKQQSSRTLTLEFWRKKNIPKTSTLQRVNDQLKKGDYLTKSDYLGCNWLQILK
uniref:Uncharacterized protein n=1 Tax=Anguilla anguilla TaxID=7936 RepID=A0A0E9WIV5_ANGAN